MKSHTPNLFAELSHQRAKLMLDDINEGLKKKVIYKMFAYIYLPDHVVYIVRNDLNKGLFNILKNNGDLPANRCVNWRILTFLRDELIELL